MLLCTKSRIKIGTVGDGVLCLKCFWRTISSSAVSLHFRKEVNGQLRKPAGGAGGRRGFGTSSLNSMVELGRMSDTPVEFFDKSGPVAYSHGKLRGGYFFGNERLFVGRVGTGVGRELKRRWTVNVAAVSTSSELNGFPSRPGEVPVLTPTSHDIGRRNRVLKTVQGQIQVSEQENEKLKEGQGKLQDDAVSSAADSAIIPPDASAILSNHSATLPKQSLKRTLFAFLALTKPRLTFLVVLSAAASYALFPVDPLLSSVSDTLLDDTTAPSLSTLTLLYLTLGTSLCSSSANTLNMYMEPKYDGQMTRTRNRPLVRGLLSGRQAIIFAILTGISGTTALYFGVNPTVSALALSNIVLYAGIYTPLKRISVLNTWVGAIVGGIPPLMGWAAAAGGVTTVDDQNSTFWEQSRELLSHPGGWLLAALLFAWQFPHFNALSYTIRSEYKNAGYRMLAWVNPSLNARVALRYSLLCLPICFGLTVVGVTDKGFLVTSALVNTWLIKEAWRFWKEMGIKGSARGLFWASVWHLPGVMVLAMVHKSGLWSGVWRGLVGEKEEELGEEAYEN